MGSKLNIPASVIETLANRASFYDMLAVFYRNALSQQQIDQLADFDFASLDVDDELMRAGFDDIRRYLRKRNTGTRQALATDYTSTFAGLKTYKEKTAIPCASLFVSGLGHFYAERHRIVYGIYKQECIRVAEGVNLPADHLAFELEFLGIMSSECRDALERGDAEVALHKLDVSIDFIDNQILDWFGKFEEVAKEIVATRFYRGVIRITQGWLEFDRQTAADVRDVIAETIGGD